jgi:hypothetical protein
MGEVEDVEPGTGHWSNLGLDGKAQPDNFRYRTTDVNERDDSKREMCLAVKLVEGEEQ